MAKFVKGDIIVIPFPFSDLTRAKRRSALVVAELEGENRILCQITSQKVRDRYAIEIDDNYFVAGGLKQRSNVRPNRVFTTDILIILYKVGHLGNEKISEVIERVVEILRQ